MFHRLFSIDHIPTRSFTFSLTLIYFLSVASMLSSSSAASIVTLSSSTSHRLEFLTNKSYRHLILRQYFLDLVNHSNPALVQSMIAQHQLVSELEQRSCASRMFFLESLLLLVENQRRKRSVARSTDSFTPMLTLQPSDCFVHSTAGQVHSIFPWSHAIESLASIELIYHIDQPQAKHPALPIRILFKQAQSAVVLSTLESHLEFDPSRAFYFLRLSASFPRTALQGMLIETITSDQTCQSSHSYLILSMAKLPASLSFTPPVTSACTLKTIPIDFEELGLAYFIIRPQQYRFTYCDGACSSSPAARSSLHSLLQSILHRKELNLPPPRCVPSQYADDQFLLRHADGTMNIHPIANLLVQQCACR